VDLAFLADHRNKINKSEFPSRFCVQLIANIMVFGACRFQAERADSLIRWPLTLCGNLNPWL
jgi:hypothetical protein